jgi:ubiquinone/menaquinone biosynthesis C-methylase UbiE
MGYYERRVLPRILNMACGTKAVRPYRERACSGLKGEVVEIGFGSGLNVEFYPPTVDRVTAIEPSDLAWKLAAKRVQTGAVPIERGGLDGQALPFADDSFDAVLSTWTMCTIPDLDAALGELQRVLRPGGTLHFLEHGLAPDERVTRWQRRLDPIERRLVGGCMFTRPIVDLVTKAGFAITDLDMFYEKGSLKFAGATSLGVAIAA